MTDKLQVTLGIEQADATVSALDLASRLMAGQIDELAHMARDQRLRVRIGDDGKWRPATAEEADRIEGHANAIADILGHRRSHWGVGSRGLPIEAKRQYEVKKAMSRPLAHRRDPGGNTVAHDGLGPRYTQDDAPVATITAG